MQNVRAERTGWRDLSLSKRHREWGTNCPAVDVDHFIEFDNRIPVAFIEYKAIKLNDDFLVNSSSIEALYNFSKTVSLPFFVVEYYKIEGITQWAITGCNQSAVKRLSFFGDKANQPHRIECNESEYVSFLYWIRGREVPPEIIKHITENPV